MEAACFYLYMLATVIYIVWRMMVGAWCKSAYEKSDMYKATTDFIEYANINLTWFAFNIVVCLMPPVCMFALQSDYLEIADQDGSYVRIMYTLWGMHTVHFLSMLRIYAPAHLER